MIVTEGWCTDKAVNSRRSDQYRRKEMCTDMNSLEPAWLVQKKRILYQYEAYRTSVVSREIRRNEKGKKKICLDCTLNFQSLCI